MDLIQLGQLVMVQLGGQELVILSKEEEGRVPNRVRTHFTTSYHTLSLLSFKSGDSQVPNRVRE